MTVKWKVAGNPRLCRYFQRESGIMAASRPGFDPEFKLANWMVELGDTPAILRDARAVIGTDPPVMLYGTKGATYTDFPGFGFFDPAQPTHKAAWEININLRVTLVCQSSNGRLVVNRQPWLTIQNTSFPPK